jgi:hypothetical protein
MTGFCDLSDELLLNIVSCLALPSILPFSLVNKHIHGLCESVLSESQLLHQKWGRVCLRFDWNRDFIMFLDALFRDPNITWHILELDTRLGDPDDWASTAFDDTDVYNQDQDVNMSRLRDRVVSSSHLGDGTHQA